MMVNTEMFSVKSKILMHLIHRTQSKDCRMGTYQNNTIFLPCFDDKKVLFFSRNRVIFQKNLKYGRASTVELHCNIFL